MDNLLIVFMTFKKLVKVDQIFSNYVSMKLKASLNCTWAYEINKFVLDFESPL